MRYQKRVELNKVITIHYSVYPLVQPPRIQDLDLRAPFGDRSPGRPVELSKTCCTVSALTGEQVTGVPLIGLQKRQGGSNENIYIGIDWSQNKHNLCFLNQAGSTLDKLLIPHSQKGFWQLEETQEKLGVEVEDCLLGYCPQFPLQSWSSLPKSSQSDYHYDWYIFWGQVKTLVFWGRDRPVTFREWRVINRFECSICGTASG
jgi:hypothetical protein